MKRPSTAGLYAGAVVFAVVSLAQFAALWVRLRFTRNTDALWVHWVCGLVFAGAAAAFFYAAQRIRTRWNRLESGACLRCGYLLTANASGVCPECGAAIPPPQ